MRLQHQVNLDEALNHFVAQGLIVFGKQESSKVISKLLLIARVPTQNIPHVNVTTGV